MNGSRSGPLLSTFSNVSASPKWSMNGKSQAQQKNGTPGPGAYAADDIGSNKYGRSPNYGFGAAARDGMRPQTAPGPGQYRPVSPKEDSAAKYGFGTSDRVHIKNRHDQPGPASYQIPGKMGYEGPKYSNVGRRNGAGYNNTPGPGAYAPDDKVKSQLGRTQQWGFGTSPREGRIAGGSPGPGSYDQKSSIKEGPQFSMKARNEQLPKATSPGPGEYGGVYTQFGGGG